LPHPAPSNLLVQEALIAWLNGREEKMSEQEIAGLEVSDKDQVIAHLTKTLALTRDYLEKARVALEKIAEIDSSESHARCREIAQNALKEI
jgi:hypothetical protein